MGCGSLVLLALWFEVGFSGFPGIGDFDKDGGDESLQGFLAWEEPDDAGAAFDLAVEGFGGVGGSQFPAMGLGQIEDGEALGEVFLGPGDEPGLFLAPGFEEDAQALLGVGAGFGVEDGGDLGGDEGLEFLFGDEVASVLLEMELAALPGAGVAGGPQGGFEAGVGIGDDEVGNADAALLEPDEESAPVDFGLGERATDAEDHAFAVVAADADGFEGGAVAHGAVDADFVVGGVEDEVLDFGQWAGAPFGEFVVELFVEVGDLAGGDLEAAKIFHDFGDAAGADALDVEGGDGGLEGAVAAGAFFKQRGAERRAAAAHLGDGQLEGTDGRLEGSWFETVGVAIALDAALVRTGTDVTFTLDEHGSVHEELGDVCETIAEAIGEKSLEELVLKGIVGMFVHGLGLLA